MLWRQSVISSENTRANTMGKYGSKTFADGAMERITAAMKIKQRLAAG